MNKELTLKLVKRFPVLYQDFYSSMRESCMCWGFEHGDGWFHIIWQLSLAIEDHLNYSWLQKRFFLFKKKAGRHWNEIIYKLSPVQEAIYKTEGKGVKGDPIRRVLVQEKPLTWDEKIVNKLFGPKKWEMAGKEPFFTTRLGLKSLAWWPRTGLAVIQVKQKYSALRVYVNGDDTIEQYVDLAERVSASTCERCGAYGKERGRGWVYTSCDKCEEKESNGVL